MYWIKPYYIAQFSILKISKIKSKDFRILMRKIAFTGNENAKSAI